MHRELRQAQLKKLSSACSRYYKSWSICLAECLAKCIHQELHAKRDRLLDNLMGGVSHLVHQQPDQGNITLAHRPLDPERHGPMRTAK